MSNNSNFHNGMWPNAVTQTTIPPWILTRAIKGAMSVWDDFWKPIMQRYMPIDTADGGNEKFERHVAIAPGMISQFTDIEARTTFITEGYKKEDFHARRTAIGFYMSPKEMVYGVNGKVSRLTKNCAKAISRRIEYEALKYASGETGTIRNFSPNVQTSRMLTANLDSSTYGFTGTKWDVAGSHPFIDIDNAQEKEDLAGDREFVAMVIGPTTWKILKNHSDVLQRIQYVKNIVDGSVIGATFNGMEIDVIRGQTYKEIPGMTSLPDSPGLGDLQEFTWDEINKKRFMFHTVSDVNYEYVLLMAERNIGNIVFARDHPDDSVWNQGQPFTRTWKSDDPEYRYWAFSKTFTPYVEDYVTLMRLNKAVTIT